MSFTFTDAQKNDIRRYCGYYVFGNQPQQGFAWRFTNHYGHLEYLMNNLTADQGSIVLTTYIPTLAMLETAIPTATQNLDTTQAAVWTWNKYEIRDRWRLFNDWRRYLCGFLGVELGPMLMSNNISFVV